MKERFREKLRWNRTNYKKLETINKIIEEYAEQGYKLTLRQLYYQLVSRDIIPNQVTEYSKLSTLLVKGRMGKVDSMIAGLKINVEAYPQLKSDNLYKEFMEEIRITEDRINSARTGYNEIVREYETSRVTFPRNIVANKYRFIEINYYNPQREEVSGKAPGVDVWACMIQ